MALNSTQIATLRTLSTSGRPACAGYWEVVWDDSDPSETRYYAESAWHEQPPFIGIGVTIDPRVIGSIPKDLEFEINPDIRTDEIDIELDDIDKEITGRFQTYGSGVAVTLNLYYPDVNGTEQVWFGQLQAPEIYGWKSLKLVATNGFRSRELLLPGSYRPPDHCRFTFGGLLADAESVRSNGCPYDRHVGGSRGNLLLGQPYQDCTLTKAACAARLGGSTTNPPFYGGYDNNVAPLNTDGQQGYLAYSRGNASNLPDPPRVIFGYKEVNANQLLLWRRELDSNPDDPEDGFVATVWEVGEGPVVSITNIELNDLLINPFHTGIRLGDRGQNITQYAPDMQHYSGVANFFARGELGNPLRISPANLKSSCKVTGFRDVVQFISNAGPGLLGTYYADAAWGSEVAQRIDFNAYFAESVVPPLAEIPFFTPFSFTLEGEITFEFSETYTFTCIHQGGVRLTIDGSVKINQLATNGTHTGTFAATAATPVTFLLEFTTFSAAVYPWEMQLKWSSASQAIEVIPGSAFEQDGSGDTIVRGWSDDRVWCLLTAMNNHTWGMRYPLSRFDSDSWRHTAATLNQSVTHTIEYLDGETITFTGRRSSFNCIMEGRPADEQIIDICRSGGFTVPFQHQGKFEVHPYRPFSTSELAAARVFTDTGEDQNILWQDGQPAITLSWVPNDKLVNDLEIQYESATDGDKADPIKIDDKHMQRLAGRALGASNYLQKVTKKYSAFGVRTLQEATRLGRRWLWFGEFDEGGTQNNMRAELVVPFEHVLGLKRHSSPIELDTALLNGHLIGTDDGVIDLTETPRYFRVLAIYKLANGLARIVAQAYNQTAYEDFETTLTPPSVPGDPPGPPFPFPPDDPNPGPIPFPPDNPRQFPPIIDSVNFTADYSDGYINVEVTS